MRGRERTVFLFIGVNMLVEFVAIPCELYEKRINRSFIYVYCNKPTLSV